MLYLFISQTTVKWKKYHILCNMLQEKNHLPLHQYFCALWSICPPARSISLTVNLPPTALRDYNAAYRRPVPWPIACSRQHDRPSSSCDHCVVCHHLRTHCRMKMKNREKKEQCKMKFEVFKNFHYCHLIFVIVFRNIFYNFFFFHFNRIIVNVEIP